MSISQLSPITEAILFAAQKHNNQMRKWPPNIQYIYHPIDVATEIIYYSGLSDDECILAQITAILHDTIEDTDTTFTEINDKFGLPVANGVMALSKDKTPKKASKKLKQYLKKIKKQPTWVWCVKLADRISNLKIFPSHWSRKKVEQYLNEAKTIADELGSASEGLNARLRSRIQEARMMLAIKN